MPDLTFQLSKIFATTNYSKLRFVSEKHPPDQCQMTSEPVLKIYPVFKSLDILLLLYYYYELLWLPLFC